MVELEDLSEPNDISELRRMIETHYRYTGSTAARRLIDNWEDMLPKFIKVMPVDYKRALEQMRKENGE